MFGFASKKENPERQAAREEFESSCRKLKAADELVQIAVGHAINMANSMFIKTFGSVDRFRQIPDDQKSDYIRKLTIAEVGFRDEQKDMATSIGFGLFKMWVGMVTTRDTELTMSFARELAYFSRKGNLGV